jgi:hypothetical protein
VSTIAVRRLIWNLTYRADPWSCAVADRHYNRQKVGTPQFVPPGRCLVFRAETDTGPALWTSSWPFAEYVKHAWPGAWVNSLFRSEGAGKASELILSAVAATRFFWPPPQLGLVTFVDPKAVPGVMVRGERVFGFSYLKAGFKHVGFTKGGLWAWQLLPEDMPEPDAPAGAQLRMIA